MTYPSGGWFSIKLENDGNQTLSFAGSELASEAERQQRVLMRWFRPSGPIDPALLLGTIARFARGYVSIEDMVNAIEGRLV